MQVHENVHKHKHYSLSLETQFHMMLKISSYIFYNSKLEKKTAIQKLPGVCQNQNIMISKFPLRATIAKKNRKLLENASEL